MSDPLAWTLRVSIEMPSGNEMAMSFRLHELPPSVIPIRDLIRAKLEEMSTLVAGEII